MFFAGGPYVEKAGPAGCDGANIDGPAVADPMAGVIYVASSSGCVEDLG